MITKVIFVKCQFDHITLLVKNKTKQKNPPRNHKIKAKSFNAGSKVPHPLAPFRVSPSTSRFSHAMLFSGDIPMGTIFSHVPMPSFKLDLLLEMPFPFGPLCKCLKCLRAAAQMSPGPDITTLPPFPRKLVTVSA